MFYLHALEKTRTEEHAERNIHVLNIVNSFGFEDTQEMILEQTEMTKKIMETNNVSLEYATAEINYMSQMMDAWFRDPGSRIMGYWIEFYTKRKAMKVEGKTWLESMIPSGEGVSLVRTRRRPKRKAVLRRVYDDWTTLTQYTIFLQILTSGTLSADSVRQNLRSGVSIV